MAAHLFIRITDWLLVHPFAPPYALLAVAFACYVADCCRVRR